MRKFKFQIYYEFQVLTPKIYIKFQIHWLQKKVIPIPKLQRNCELYLDNEKCQALQNPLQLN